MQIKYVSLYTHFFLFLRISWYSLNLKIFNFFKFEPKYILSRSALILTVAEKFHTRKKPHFEQNKTKQKNKANTFLLENMKMMMRN